MSCKQRLHESRLRIRTEPRRDKSDAQRRDTGVSPVREVWCFLKAGWWELFYSRSRKPLSWAQYHRLLQHPISCSIISYSGETYEGKHDPIITKALFDKVQAVITRKTKPKTPELKPFLYRGLFRCGGCGCFITTETQKSHNYLRCTKRVKKDCPEAYVREESIATQIIGQLGRMAIPARDADQLIDQLEAEQSLDTKAKQDSCISIRSKVQELEQKLLA